MNKQNDDAQVTCDQQPNTSNTFKHPVAKHGPSDLLQQTRGRFSRPIRVHSFRPRPSPEGFARESPGGSSVVLSVFLEGKTGSHELWKLPSSILPLHPPPLAPACWSAASGVPSAPSGPLASVASPDRTHRGTRHETAVGHRQSWKTSGKCHQFCRFGDFDGQWFSDWTVQRWLRDAQSDGDVGPS